MKALVNRQAETANSQEQRELIFKFDLMCKNLPSWILLGNFVIASILVFVVVGNLSIEFRLTWLLCITLLTATRHYYLRQWKAIPSTAKNVHTRIVVACTMAFLISMMLGFYGAIALTENNITSTTIVMLLSAGLMASAAVSLGHIPRVFFCFTVPLIVPFVVRVLMFSNTFYHMYAGMMILFGIYCFQLCHGLSQSVSQSIRIRSENMDLLADLQLEKRRTNDLLSNLQQEKTRAEEALSREAQANIAKSKFLAAASHDLRQPLNSLRLFTTTLEMETRDTQHRVLASQIDASVESLEGLFNVLLDISKLDAGTLPVDKRPTDLGVILKRVTKELEPLAHQKNLRFLTDYQSHSVVTDALLLERLLRNLVNNAISYTSSGHVSVSTRLLDRTVEIEISDTGSGIPQDDQARIYEEFVQLDNPSRDKDQGIGLGLSIVKRIAELLNIPVSLDSVVGLGSSFLLKVELASETSSRLDVTESAPAEISIGSVDVLVVDDDLRTCSALEGLLRAWGASVVTATSGNDAVVRLKQENFIPDVIISDYRLKNFETGGDAIRTILDFMGYDVPAIVLTGDISPERLLEIRALGYPLLHKPCKSLALRKLIAQEAKRQSSAPDKELEAIEEL